MYIFFAEIFGGVLHVFGRGTWGILGEYCVRTQYIGANSFAGVRSGHGAACVARRQVGGERERLRPNQKKETNRHAAGGSGVYANRTASAEAVASATFFYPHAVFNYAVNRDFRNSCVYLCVSVYNMQQAGASEPKAVQSVWSVVRVRRPTLYCAKVLNY